MCSSVCPFNLGHTAFFLSVFCVSASSHLYPPVLSAFLKRDDSAENGYFSDRRVCVVGKWKGCANTHTHLALSSGQWFPTDNSRSQENLGVGQGIHESTRICNELGKINLIHVTSVFQI